MRNFSLFILVLLLAVPGFGQNDSIQQEILNYSESKTELISKGRRFLLEKFLGGDMEKVKQIKDYLVQEVQNEDYLALYPGEHWLILYWTGEHEELLPLLSSFGEEEMAELQKKIKPNHDMLYDKLTEKSRNSLAQLQASVLDSELKDEDYDFLLLYLKFLLTDPAEPEREQNRINQLANVFLSTYPNSKYEKVIRNNIRYVLVPSRWGADFEFFTGYGYFTDALSDHYQNNIPIGIAFDFEYDKFTLFLRNYIGFSFTRKDRPFNGGVWKEDSQVRVYLPEASLGYAVVNSRKLKISPFAGIGSTSISATEYDLQREPDLEQVELDFTTTYMAGVNLDIKLNWGADTPPLHYAAYSYWFLRLRYAYSRPQFQSHYPAFSGDMHYLTVGIGALYRGAKRQL